MSRPTAREPCPFCGASVSVTAARCPACGEELFEDEPERPRPIRNLRRQDTVEPTEFLIPTGVSAWAIASCYMGLIGFCLPIIGLLFAVPAVICGIVALRQWRAATSYGSVTSNIRTIIGLVLGSLGTLIWGAVLISILLSSGHTR